MKKKLIQFIFIILVVSGLIFSSKILNVKASENQWISLSPMSTERGDHGMVEVNGKIYVIGGRNDNGNLAINEEYDIHTDIWTTKANMPTARSSFSIAVYQNKIFCIGGITGDINNPELTGIIEVYDPVADSWEVKTSMPTARADLCANVVNESIYLIGGKSISGITASYQESGLNEVYFPDNDSWTTKYPMFIPVFGYTSVVVDGKIYIIGGARQFEEGGSGTPVRFNQMYDPEIDAWRNLALMPNIKSQAGSGVTKGETAPILIYSIGGLDQTGISDTNYVYSIEYNNWTAAAPIPSPRANLAIVEVNDILFSIGGFDGKNWLNINEQYKPLDYGTILPKISLLSPENKTYSSNNVSLIMAINRATSWISNSLDDSENVTISSDTVLEELADGSHKVIVYINDTFGNIVASEAVYFSVDTTPPIISVLSPENRAYGETDIQTTIVINEPVSWLGYSLDGQEIITISGNVTLAVLSEGGHFIDFYATDIIGNNGTSTTIQFRIVPFPTLIVVSSILIIIIIIMALYLFFNRNSKEK